MANTGDRENSDCAGVRPSRRGVLLGGIAGLAAMATAGASVRTFGAEAGAATSRGAGEKVKNLIMLVPDGMSTGAVSLLDRHKRLTTGKPSFWHSLRGAKGTMHANHTTDAYESLVTDSAAASSAWSTGIKHKIKSLCVTPDGRQPSPIFMRAKAAGYKVGCVTTTTITHATPAGFYCNMIGRGSEAEIGQQLIERGVDVAVGGGAKFVDPAVEAAQTAGKANGLIVARTMMGLRAAMANPAPRVLGLMSSDQIPYVLERRAASTEQFNLAEAAILAANRLAAGGKFVLQVEAGRVDHAAHNNDAPALLAEMMEFDATLEALVGFTRATPGTLLVVVADHATANPGLTVYGPKGQAGMEKLAAAKHSFEWMIDKVNKENEKPMRGAALAQFAELHLGIRLGADAPGLLQSVHDARQVDPFGARSSLIAVLGSLCGNEFGVGFVSVNHTSDAVDLLAIGAGAESLPGMIDNTEVHEWFCGLLGLKPSIA